MSSGKHEILRREFGSDNDLLEWVDWEIERVRRSMLVVSGAIGARPEDGKASVRDSDLDGMLCMLAERLSEARQGLAVMVEKTAAQQQEILQTFRVDAGS